MNREYYMLTQLDNYQNWEFMETTNFQLKMNGLRNIKMKFHHINHSFIKKK